MLNAKIQLKLKERIGEIKEVLPVSGGCICKSYSIKTNQGKYFCKTTPQKGLFVSESTGLKELASTKIVNTPKLVDVSEDYLLLEWLEPGIGPKKEELQFLFGKQLAKLHKVTSQSFGFHRDTFLGTTLQDNKEQKSWLDFYLENRLKPQVRAIEKKYNLEKSFKNLFKNFSEVLPSLIKGTEESPSLIHGDLWSGNYLISKGKVYIFDPAVYYGHREIELAMTQLFGGFHENFYKGYHSENPLAPGFKDRVPIYQLYHLLNHLNLFGKSYYSQVVNIMRKYV